MTSISGSTISAAGSDSSAGNQASVKPLYRFCSPGGESTGTACSQHLQPQREGEDASSAAKAFLHSSASTYTTVKKVEEDFLALARKLQGGHEPDQCEQIFMSLMPGCLDNLPTDDEGDQSSVSLASHVSSFGRIFPVD